ncbi:MAG: hypothetical protein RL385_1834 [Pseudomonadota bacterium]
MGRKSNTEERRAQIVEAMLHVIAHHGYEGATVQLIAAQAGLSPGLIHYHYADKREIVVALVHALGQQATLRFEAASAGAKGAEACVKAYIDTRLGLGRGGQADAVAAWVAIGAEAIRQPQIRQAYQDAIGKELALLRTLIGDWLLEEGKPRSAAAEIAPVLMAFVEGAFQLSTAARRVMPKGYAAEAALTLVGHFVRSARG